MSKKRQQTQLEFQAAINSVQITYPVVVSYSAGYNKGIEAFFENGVRFFIETKDDSISFLKSKWTPSTHNELNEDLAREEYEHTIKKLVYLHEQVSIEEFNRRYEYFDKINSSLDQMQFFELLNKVEFEENWRSIVKTKQPVTNESTAKPGADEDHPF